jgi:O-antigen/teichoic acid export membrane protein
MPLAASTTRPPEPPADLARRVGQGALLLTVSKFYFLAATYGTYFAIERISSAAGRSLLGDFKAVGAFVSVVNTIAVAATVQAVSRFTSRLPEAAARVRNRWLSVQVPLAVAVALGFALITPALAGAGRAKHLGPALRVAALIPLLTAVGAVLLGGLNGIRAFRAQAWLDLCNTTLKAGLVVAGVALGGSILAAYAGFALSAGVVLVLGLLVSFRLLSGRRSPASELPGRGSLLRFQMQTVGFMLLTQWFVQMDIWYLQIVLRGGEEHLEAGRNLYAAIQLFSSVPYSVVTAIVLVLFPLVASGEVESQGDSGPTVRAALRYASILLGGLVALLVAHPRHTLAILLRDLDGLLGHHPGGELGLIALALGYLAFCPLFLLGSVANARGRPRDAIGWMLVLVVVQAGAAILLVPRLGLPGQALASALGATAALLVSTRGTARALGPVWSPRTLLRVAGAAVAAMLITRSIPAASALGSLLAMAVGGCAYFLLLGLFREFSAEDRERLRRVLGRVRP